MTTQTTEELEEIKTRLSGAVYHFDTAVLMNSEAIILSWYIERLETLEKLSDKIIEKISAIVDMGEEE